jgi:hypothetical protein
LNYLKNNKLFINGVFDVAIKFQSNPLNPTRDTHHPYAPTSEQTENVNSQN